MNKIGVFGGTFDPVHYGHIHLAEQALNECKLSEVLVVPVKIQPFKQDQHPAPATERFNMAKLAFAGRDNISVSDVELKRNGISYTIDTLREIKKTRGSDTVIAFILGADSFLKIEKWKGSDELLTDYSFIIGTRPGYRREELDSLISRLEKSYGTDVVTIKNKQIPASSTGIKEMIKSGKSCKGIIPPDVERYIHANGLYL